jgi:hypothetical protein
MGARPYDRPGNVGGVEVAGAERPVMVRCPMTGGDEKLAIPVPFPRLLGGPEVPGGPTSYLSATITVPGMPTHACDCKACKNHSLGWVAGKEPGEWRIRLFLSGITSTG